MSRSQFFNGAIVLLTTLLLPSAAYAEEAGETTTSTAIPKSVTSANLETIGIARIHSAIPPGSVIGERFCSSSLVRTRCGENTVSGMSSKAESGYKTIIEEELKKAGYPVSGGSGSVFEDVSSEAKPTRFLIGATIAKAEAHTIESENVITTHSSWKTKAKVTIRWEVLDQQTKKVIYNKETIGESKVPGREVAPAAYEATRESLKVVLADSNFIATLRSASSTANISTTPLPTQAETKPVNESNGNAPMNPLTPSPAQVEREPVNNPSTTSATSSPAQSESEPVGESADTTPAPNQVTPSLAKPQEKPVNENVW